MKIDVDFELFGILAFYSAILLAKVLLMPVLVARTRMEKKVSDVDESTCSGSDEASAGKASEVFANPEDKAFARGGEVSIKHTDQDVERIRRAHLNDIENVLPFIFLAVMFCFTNPGVEFTRCMFQIFVMCRVGHSIFYCVPRARKPWLRFASCGVGWLINAYMAYSVFMYNL